MCSQSGFRPAMTSSACCKLRTKVPQSHRDGTASVSAQTRSQKLFRLGKGRDHGCSGRPSTTLLSSEPVRFLTSWLELTAAGWGYPCPVLSSSNRQRKGLLQQNRQRKQLIATRSFCVACFGLDSMGIEIPLRRAVDNIEYSLLNGLGFSAIFNR